MPLTESEELELLNLEKEKSSQDKPVAKPEEDAVVHVPEIVQGGVQGFQKMRRGVRAVGVGAENLVLQPMNDPKDYAHKVIERSNAALQPGFKPEKGEKFGTFVAGMVDPVNLAASAIIPGAGLLSAGAAGATAVGVDDLLDQIEKNGSFKPGEVGVSALVGGALGLGTHMLTSGIASGVENAPTILKAMAGVPKRATKILMENKDLMETWKGSPEEISNLSKNVDYAANEVKQKAQSYFDKALGKIGLRKTSGEMIDAERPKFRKTEIRDEDGKLIGFGTPRIMNYSGEYTPKEVQTNLQTLLRLGNKIKDSDRLKLAFNLRRGIDTMVDMSDRTGVVRPTLEGGKRGVTQEQAIALLGYRKILNRLMDSDYFPGGKILRNADQRLHAASTLFTDLQEHLSDPVKTEKFFRKTFEHDDAESVHNLTRLMALEKETGKPVTSNLFKSLSSETFRKAMNSTKVRASVAGVSAWIIARALGIPYAAAIGLAAASQSPALLRRVVRGGQMIAPLIRESEVPAFLSGMEGAEVGMAPLLHGGQHTVMAETLHGGIHTMLPHHGGDQEGQ